MNNRMFGRVIEIFFLEDSDKIGFKVNIDDKIITIIEEQNEENANIYKDDFVFVNKYKVDNQEIFEIESLGDVDDE